MDSQEPPHPHAVVVSGPGLGHVNGCLLLVKSLLSVDFSVTLACFARTYSTHASKACFNHLSHPSVRLEIVPDGLSPHADSYADLFVTTPAMQQGLLHLLQTLTAEGHPPTCLIADSIMAWTQDVADEVSIPRVDFWTAAATSYLTVLALPDLLSQGLVGSHKGPKPLGWKSKNPVFVDCVPGLPKFPLDEVPSDFRYCESDQNPVFKAFLTAGQRAKDADCVLIHSIQDLEKESFNALKQAAGLEAYAIGPLLHQSDQSSGDSTMTWLDSQADSSVIYVSFGSNVMLTEQEIVELALGLEASKQAFLWVIRSDATEKGRGIDDILPRDFRARTTEQGLIMPWVSQMAVLQHPAVGGFLSHCGWNSTLETLWMGVPVLAVPRRAEQPLNCRLMVQDWGIGIELESSQEGTFFKEQVEKGIRTLLQGELGHMVRLKAKQLSQVVRKARVQGGQSYSNLVEFATKMKRRSHLRTSHS